MSSYKIAFPDVHRFEELFPVSVPHNPKGAVTLAQKDSWMRETGKRHYPCLLTGYISIDGPDGFRSLDAVELAPCVVDYFRANVLGVENDRVTFTIRDRGDGTALVIMQHGQIIGSHWLAVISSDSIPVDIENGKTVTA